MAKLKVNDDNTFEDVSKAIEENKQKARVFISHPYSDNPELRLKQNDYICRNLPDNILPISPLHLFSFEEDDSRREEILQVCFDLIDMCDYANFYMYGDLSEGQIKELNYCNLTNTMWTIIKPPEKCMEIEENTFREMVNEGWI